MKTKLDLNQKVNVKTKQQLYIKIAAAAGILSIIAVAVFFTISYFSSPKDTLAGGNNPAIATTKTVIISEFAGKGHDGEKRDQFVELYNMTPYSINLSTFELEYYSSNNKSNTISLTGTIPSKGYYVIAVSNGTKAKDKPTNNLSYDYLVPGNGWKINGNIHFLLKDNNVIVDFAGNASNKLKGNDNYDRVDLMANGADVTQQWLEISSNESTPDSKNKNQLPTNENVSLNNVTYDFAASSSKKPAVSITSKGNKHPGKITVTVNPAESTNAAIPMILRSIDISPSVQPDNITLEYYYLESELNGLDESKLVLYSNHNGVWTLEGGIVDTINNKITLTNVSHFSIWSAGEGSGTGILPIELASFNGEFENDKVVLKWTTATEINNEYFTIESSENGIDFKEIGKVTGAGNSITEQNYSLIDNNPSGNIIYYRLTQTDYDGKYEVFPLISVKNDQEITDLTIESFGPNPIEDFVNIRLNSNIRGSLLLNLYNAQGSIVRKQQYECERGINTLELNGLGSLKSGFYLLNITSENSATKTIRLIKR